MPTAAEAVLSPRALNRAVLARQLLLEPAMASIPEVLQRICGIQAQYAPSIYLGLRARLRGLARDAVTAALEDGSVIQATLMRETIHAVARNDFGPMAAAVRQERRRWFLGVRVPGRDGVEQQRAELAARMAELADRTRVLLRDGPLRRGDLLRELDVEPALFSGIGLWVDLVRVPPSGTWERRRADLYGLAEQWLSTHPPADAQGTPPPATPPPTPPTSPPTTPPPTSAQDEEREGRRLLVERYLRAFGPASRKDVQGFTGLALPAVDEVLGTLTPRRMRTESGEALLDLPDAPLPDPDTPAPVRFLPTYDATLLVHARRAQILPEPFRPLVFSSANPQSVPTFLVDGQVAGTWRFTAGQVQVRPFEPLDRRVRAAVDAEARAVAQFHR